MRATASYLLALVLWAGLLAPAGAQDTARGWLERMIRATQTLSYEGTFIYIHGQAVDIMAILHSNQDGQGRQRMYSLSGPRREVLVNDGQVMCLLPDRRFAFRISRFERSPFPISFPNDLDRLAQSYEFDLAGADRVLDRPAQIVSVRPRDDMRYGYRLWLDRATGLVLRSALVGESQDQYLEQLVFTELNIRDRIDPQRLLPSAPDQALLKTVALQQEPSASVEPNWRAESLPPSFVQVMYQPHGTDDQSRATHQLVFSDGLATVSVFVEPLVDEPLLQGASHMDAMNTYGVVLDDRYQVIAVGEVPVKTVAKIASSIVTIDPER
ncbi:MAG: MucB/RseB C-terminal domain-containing protein [Candidatus Competibacterales bacterium]|nr:MucB/RseB C-terminal domain-containing protein [Candidatus Competibacterales bacterium]